jgi:exosortase
LYYLYVHREQLLNPVGLSAINRRSMGLQVGTMAAIGLFLPLLLVYPLAYDWFVPISAIVGLLGVALFGLCIVKSGSPIIKRAHEHSAGWLGGAILLFGLALFGYAIYPGQNDFLKDFGMVVTLFGVVLALGGWGIMRIAWFPIVFLVCGIPWPGLMYSRVASPLQQLAANVAVRTLELTGVDSSVSGTKIFIAGQAGVWRTLNVAEACAGLRSLMTFISVAATVAFLSHRPLWQKLTVTLSAIPIAIFCNVMRVSGQGLLDHYVSQQLSESFAHQFVGLIMLIPAFVLILLVGWILDRIFVEEVDRRHVAIAPQVIRRADRQTTPTAVAAPIPAPGSLAARRATMAAKPAPPKAAPSRPPINPKRAS